MSKPKHDSGSERGDRASFDPRTGEVHGSGSGAGGSGNPAEDYDEDPKGGSGEVTRPIVEERQTARPGEGR